MIQKQFCVLICCLVTTAGLPALGQTQTTLVCCCEENPNNGGCIDAACMSTVCALDPYCCNAYWDTACVGEANTYCTPEANLPTYCDDCNVNGTSDACEGYPSCGSGRACGNDDINRPGFDGKSSWTGPTSGTQQFEDSRNWSQDRPGYLTQAVVTVPYTYYWNDFTIEAPCDNAVQSLTIFDRGTATGHSTTFDLLYSSSFRFAGAVDDLVIAPYYYETLHVKFKNGWIVGPNDRDFTLRSSGAADVTFDGIGLVTDTFRVRSDLSSSLDDLILKNSGFHLLALDFQAPDSNNYPSCKLEMWSSYLGFGQGESDPRNFDIQSNLWLSVRDDPSDQLSAPSKIEVNGGKVRTHANSFVSVQGDLNMNGDLEIGGGLVGSATCFPESQYCAPVRISSWDFDYPTTTSAYMRMFVDLSGYSGFPTSPLVYASDTATLGGVFLVDCPDTINYPPSTEFSCPIVTAKSYSSYPSKHNFEIVRTLPGQELAGGLYLATEKVGDTVSLVVKQAPEVEAIPRAEAALSEVTVKSVVLMEDPFIMATLSKSSNGSTSMLRVLKDSGGQLVQIDALEGPPDPTDMASGDIDGDGKFDMAVSYGDPGKVVAYRFTTTGIATMWSKSLNSGPSYGNRATCVTVYPPTNPNEPRVAFGWSSPGLLASTGKVTTLGNDGSTDAEAAVAGIPTTVRGSDVDDDGDIDASTGGTGATALQGEGQGFVQVLLSVPEEGVLLKQVPVLVAGTPRSMAIADIDGDGLKDIAIASDGITGAFPSGLRPTATLLRGSYGSARLQVPVPLDVGTAGDAQGTSIAFTDADGDGKLDIAIGWSTPNGSGGARLMPIRTQENSTGISIGLPVNFGQTAVHALEPYGTNGLVTVSASELRSDPDTVSWTTFEATGIEGDLDGDGIVGTGDVALMLLDFGSCPGCPADLDGSGTVDSGDVAYLLLLFS